MFSGGASMALNKCSLGSQSPPAGSTGLYYQHVIKQRLEQCFFQPAGVSREAEVLGDLLHVAFTTILQKGIHPILSDVVWVRHWRILVVCHLHLTISPTKRWIKSEQARRRNRLSA